MAAGALALLGGVGLLAAYFLGAFGPTPSVSVVPPSASAHTLEPLPVPLAEPALSRLFMTRPLTAIAVVFQKHRVAAVSAMVVVCCVVAAIVVAVVLTLPSAAAAAAAAQSPIDTVVEKPPQTEGFFGNVCRDSERSSATRDSPAS